MAFEMRYPPTTPTLSYASPRDPTIRGTNWRYFPGRLGSVAGDQATARSWRLSDPWTGYSIAIPELTLPEIEGSGGLKEFLDTADGAPFEMRGDETGGAWLTVVQEPDDDTLDVQPVGNCRSDVAFRVRTVA